MTKTFSLVKSIGLIISTYIIEGIVILYASFIYFTLYKNNSSYFVWFNNSVYYFMLISWILTLLFFRLLGFKIINKKFRQNQNIMFYVLGILLGIGLNLLLSILLNYINIEQIDPNYSKQMEQLLSSGNVVLGIITIGLIGPIFEEILFRKIIFNYLKVFSPVTAIILQAILFGAYHINIIQFIYATIIGIILGFVVYWTSNLLPSIIIHCCINTISFVTDIYIIDINNFNRALISVISFIIIIYSLYKFRLFKGKYDNN